VLPVILQLQLVQFLICNPLNFKYMREALKPIGIIMGMIILTLSFGS